MHSSAPQRCFPAERGAKIRPRSSRSTLPVNGGRGTSSRQSSPMRQPARQPDPRTESKRREEAVRWVEEWFRLPLRGRILLTTYLIIGAFGGLYGAHTVLDEFSKSWVAWTLSLVVLEPVGLACAFGLIVLVFPRSRVATWFSSALKRAKIAAVVVGLVFASALLGSVSFLLYEFLKTSL